MTTKYYQLWKSIEDEEMRREFNLDVDTTLAFQIKLLREKNGWTQAQLAERAGSKQETISQWENPNYGSYTLKTLKGLATAFDVGLMVKFAKFSEIVEWNANLTPERLAPPSFTEEQASRHALGVAQAKPVFATAFADDRLMFFEIKGGAISATVAAEQPVYYARALNEAPSFTVAAPSTKEPDRKGQHIVLAA